MRPIARNPTGGDDLRIGMSSAAAFSRREKGLVRKETCVMSNLQSIGSDELVRVCGGADDGYNKEDLKNGLQGAAAGSRFGPAGTAVGFGAGFMKRKFGQLVDGVSDLWKERERAKKLEEQRQEMLRRRQ